MPIAKVVSLGALFVGIYHAWTGIRDRNTKNVAAAGFDFLVFSTMREAVKKCP